MIVGSESKPGLAALLVAGWISICGTASAAELLGPAPVVHGLDRAVYSIALGDGQGAFSAARSFLLTDGEALSIVTSDFNEDDRTDIAVGAWGLIPCYEGLIVLLSREDGGFDQLPTLTTPGVPYLLEVDDYDLDGAQDIAAVSVTSEGDATVTVFRGDGAGDTQLSY
jgi:hypothetical protein